MLSLPSCCSSRIESCRELLGQRSETELHVRRIGDAPLQIGAAIAPFKQNSVALDDQHSAHEGIVGRVGIHDLLESRDEPRVLRARQGGEPYKRAQGGRCFSRS